MTQSEFEAIAIQLRTKVHDVARQMLSSADDAEDAAGDVMLRLWTLHDQLKDGDHAIKLATVIAQRLCIDIIRRQKKKRRIIMPEFRNWQGILKRRTVRLYAGNCSDFP